MHRLGGITHPNPTVDKKVKYFYDCFHYGLSKEAQLLDGFPENHLTLLERMLFRSKNLIKFERSTQEVLSGYLCHPLFHAKNDVLGRKGRIKQGINTLKHILQTTCDVAHFNETLEKLVTELNGKKGFDGSDYFQKVLDSAITALACTHELDFHREEIEYLAKLLLAEYIRVGYDKKAITEGEGVFNRILSMNDDEGSNNTYKQFPFPPEVEGKRRTSEFDSAVDEYFKKERFRRQFEGMLHILNQENKGEFLFRVDGMEASDGLMFTHKDVRLLNVGRLTVNEPQWGEYFSDQLSEAFPSTSTIVAIVPHRFKSKSLAIAKTSIVARQALEALAYMTSKRAGVVCLEKVHIIHEKGKTSKWQRQTQLISSFDVDLLKKQNGVIPLPICCKSLQHEIERCDSILFQSLTSLFHDEAIANFWRYLEACFHCPPYNLNHGKGYELIKDLSKILVKSDAESMKKRLALLLENYAINSSNSDTGLDYLEIANFFNSSRQEPDAVVNFLEPKTQYPFIQHLISRYEGLENECGMPKRLAFYQGILMEMYEQRNMIVHHGIYCPHTVERLQVFLPSLASRWRAILFDEIEIGGHASMETAIAELVRKSKKIP